MQRFRHCRGLRQPVALSAATTQATFSPTPRVCLIEMARISGLGLQWDLQWGLLLGAIEHCVGGRSWPRIAEFWLTDSGEALGSDLSYLADCGAIAALHGVGAAGVIVLRDMCKLGRPGLGSEPDQDQDNWISHLLEVASVVCVLGHDGDSVNFSDGSNLRCQITTIMYSQSGGLRNIAIIRGGVGNFEYFGDGWKFVMNPSAIPEYSCPDV